MTDDPDPLVSIIVPCYNHARYLRECMRSIFNQTHRKIEIIAIDDGSRDASLHVLRAMQNISPFPMQVIAQHNKGAAWTINRAIAIAKGAYINPINTDDAFSVDRIAILLDALREHSGRIAFGAVTYHDDSGGDVVGSDPYATDLVDKQRAIAGFPTVGFALLASNVAISTGNMLFEKSLYDDIGPFNVEYRYCHDWDFMLRALSVTEPVFVDKPLYRYRLHTSNSFRSLQDAAGWEGGGLMRRFFRTVATDCSNKLAPSPLEWGRLFWDFIDEHGLWPYIDGSKEPA